MFDIQVFLMAMIAMSAKAAKDSLQTGGYPASLLSRWDLQLQIHVIAQSPLGRWQ